MSIFDEAQPASYAGQSFLMIRSSSSGGRKDVLNEFPNSNLQVVEDLGLRPRTFNVEAIINEDPTNNNYIPRRDNFLRVLEKGGRDLLNHPLYGAIDNIVVRSFTLIEDFNDLGAARFSIVFAISDTPGTPIASTDTLSIVSNAGIEAFDDITDNISEVLVIGSFFPANFTAAVEKVNEIVDEFARNTEFLQVAEDAIDQFSLELSELSANVTTLVNNPTALANSIGGLFQTVNGLYSTIEATFEVIKRFFDFAAQDEKTPILQNTAGRIQRARNQNLLNSQIRGQSLVLNYVNAAQINFSTTAQLDEVSQDLENQYQLLVNNTDLSVDTVSQITALRAQTRQFFEQARITTSQIIEVRTEIQPARTLAYQYYGSSELGDDIANLKEDLNVSFIEGDVEIFTE